MTQQSEFHLKKKYISKKESPINKDYFIFSLLEEIGMTGASEIEKLKEIKDLETKEALNQFFAHLKEIYPILHSKKVHHYEKHGSFLPAFAVFVVELERFWERVGKKKISKIESLETLETDELWKELWPMLDANFLTSADLVKAFFLWKYKVPKIEKKVLAQLPPVGRFISVLRRARP